ncbi:MFS transporter [Staphylococcus auricularis]|uniref:MFS transporter n=1 Tax=Staphylococcus auricularis TaxID=29379 RepID=UPI00242F321A|nr:MFS transporter [Staphylococcus auricularis]
MPIAVYILGFLVFSQTTSEFMVAGIMPSLAKEFEVSFASIGYLVSAYALGMVLGGPILTLGLLKFSRKRALLGLTIVFLIGQTIGALATNYETMMLARIITGIVSSASMGIAVAITLNIVDKNSTAKGVSIVLGGLMVATAVGLPFAILFDQFFGWRSSFWAIVILVLIATLLLFILIPSTPISDQLSVQKELYAFKNYRLWAAYLTSVLILGSTFAAFSYFTPILTELTGFDSFSIPFILVIYGVATIVGNIVIGRLADHFTLSITVVGLIVLTVTLIIFALFVENPVIAIIAVIMIGLVGISMNPALVTRITRVAGTGTLVATVHNSVINVGIIIGSAIGGLTIQQGFGLVSPLWVGAFMALLGLISLLPIIRRDKIKTNNIKSYN